MSVELKTKLLKLNNVYNAERALEVARDALAAKEKLQEEEQRIVEWAKSLAQQVPDMLENAAKAGATEATVYKSHFSSDGGKYAYILEKVLKEEFKGFNVKVTCSHSDGNIDMPAHDDYYVDMSWK